MATYNKFNQFTEDMADGVHQWDGTDVPTIFLTPTASAPVAANSVLANLTETNYTNLSTRVITITSHTQSPAGTWNLILTDLVLTASGAVAAFQYVGVYNDTPTSPADPLVGWYDHGSSVVLATSETFTIDFPATAWISVV